MSTMTIAQALREAMYEEMLRDRDVFAIGEDIGELGGPYGVTKGLLEIFGPKRVIETPISEAGFVGMSVGAAMRGMRPVAELMYIDFIGVCMDQIINQAAKMRYMTGGQVKVPMVLRVPMGSGRRNAGQHSQCLESMLTHVPGLKVVAFSDPADAKGLLKASIRDDDPVIFIEHKMIASVAGEVPEGEHIVPIGKAAVKREGRDITVIAWSRQVLFALEAAGELAKEGIDVEVLDLRSLVPLDWEAVKASVLKTRRVVVAQEAVKRGAYAGEIAAQISSELFGELRAPVGRVGALNIVPPFSPPLEDAFFPHPQDITDAVRKAMAYKRA